MEFQLSHVPFSRYGSRFSLREVPAEEGGVSLFFLPRGRVCRLEVLCGGEVTAPAVRATPESVRLSAGGTAEIAFETDERLRVRVEGVTLRLRVEPGYFNYALPRGEGRWQLNLFNTNRNFLLSALDGEITVDAPWSVVHAEYIDVCLHGEAGVVDAALEAFTTTMPRSEVIVPFADVLGSGVEGMAAFIATLPAVPEEFAAARELAGYILWSAMVSAEGHFRRDAMLMSKNHMTQVWSWDHCFNAMALAAGNPKAAWDQLVVMFDHQDADGCLPDSMSQDSIVWNFVKPPVHGWALRHMLAANPAFAGHLPEFYEKLARWTHWWLRERDDDGDGMPQYNHGNDSGWDNATCFALVPPVEGPDLAAFLITQMETLAEVADRLGEADDAEAWRQRADALFGVLINHCWDGKRFVAKRSGSHDTPPEGDSLIPFIPLLLGARLPVEIRSKLIAGVGEPERFITAWGPATESPRSPLYESDGYWRGPIWAPSTYLLYDGLRRCGETTLARDIALRFCRLCAKSGLAENFDALTGAPLRDKAYTWTASVFLLMAHDLVGEG